jgi:hypothetical protein
VVSSTSTGAGGRASSCGDAAPAGDAGCGGMAHGADGGRQQVVVGGGCGWLRGAGRSCCPWERGSVRSSLPGGEVESGQARLEPWRAGVVQRPKRLEGDEAAASNLRFQGVVHERGDCVTWRGGAGQVAAFSTFMSVFGCVRRGVSMNICAPAFRADAALPRCAAAAGADSTLYSHVARDSAERDSSARRRQIHHHRPWTVGRGPIAAEENSARAANGGTSRQARPAIRTSVSASTPRRRV